jgi:hypothetical protein
MIEQMFKYIFKKQINTNNVFGVFNFVSSNLMVKIFF